VLPVVAPIVTPVSAVTLPVLTLTVTVFEPIGTVTGDGTLNTPGLVLLIVTGSPPDGATPVRVTVTDVVVPPTTRVAAGVTDVTVGALTKSVRLTLAPASEAVTVAWVSEVTAPVLIEKVALAAPWGTVTVAGTPTAA
jgi:hypothetical protein